MIRFVAVPLVLAVSACSPAAETEEVAQTTPGVEATSSVASDSTSAADAAVAVEGRDAPSEADPEVPSEQDPPVPQGIPADPDRPVGPVVAETPKGGLSLSAFQDSMVQRVMGLDADGDGALSRDEVAAAGPGGRMISAADADRDGRVTPTEVRAGAAVMFRGMDRDGDGRLTESERPQQ